MDDQQSQSQAHAPLSYTGAMERAAALLAQDGPDVSSASRTQLMTHGARVESAAVLLHGYTSSPPQFARLGAALYDLGYNVLIPRAPHHGLADRLTGEQARLTVAELVAYATEALDVARGLGEQVTVAGLSMGAVLAGWAAHHRPDVARAMLMAPAFGLRFIAPALTPLSAALLHAAPNVFVWWDPRTRERIAGPQHAYPRLATRGLGHILALSAAVRGRAKQVRPVAGSIVVVTNASDRAVSNTATARVVAGWRRHGASLHTYEFPAELRLGHDFVDPAQPHERTDIVYPVLVELLSR